MLIDCELLLILLNSSTEGRKLSGLNLEKYLGLEFEENFVREGV